MTRQQRAPLPPPRPADVAEARQLALDLEAGDPTFEHYSTNGSDNLLWTVMFIIIGAVLIIAAGPELIAQLAPHWRGTIQAGCITVLAIGFLRGTR